MSRIEIKLTERKPHKIIAKYVISNDLSNFINDNVLFSIDYGMDISSVPESVLVVPFVANILPLAWLCNAEVICEKIDADFLADIEKAKKGYEKMYPMLNFGGKITAISEKNLPAKQIHKSACFFSGGIDAWTTLMRHIDEKPVLLTIWGSDVKTNDEKSWANVDNANKQTAMDFALEYNVIRSNFREVINEGNLSKFVQKSGDAWWHGFQHGIALIAHATPIAYLYGLKKLYIASSFPAYMAGKYTCASDPTIDNYVNFCGCHTIHDGYELDRLDKVRYLMSLSEKYTSKMKFRVCWQAESSGKNCCCCEKCYRTILELVAVNCPGGVERYGFVWNDKTIKQCEKDFKEKINILQFFVDQFYPPIQKEMLKNKDVIPNVEKYEWLLKMDFSKFNDYPMKRVKRVWGKIRTIGGRIKRKIIKK